MDRAKITILGENLTTFSIPIVDRNQTAYMAFLVIRRDNQNPNIWVLGAGVGASPQVVIKKVFDLPGTQLDSASISDNTLTLKFSTIAYGGIAVFQL